MFCTRCGHPAQPNQRFCTGCGAALATAESAPDAQPAPPPDARPQSAPVAPEAPPAAAQPTPTPPPEPVPAAPQATPYLPQPSPASVHPVPEGGLTIEELVAWLETVNLSPNVVTAESGERHLVIRIKNTPFNIFMRDGKDNRYESLELAAGFSTHGGFDTSQLNDWNSSNRWTRAYFDDVKDPWLEMDIDLYPGGTYESLNDQLIAWLNTVARFIEKYGVR